MSHHRNMDDLSGLEWAPSASNATSKPPPMSTGNYYPSLRPTPPLSGRTTPAVPHPFPDQSGTPITSRSPKPSTPSNDSFANLVSFKTTQSTKNLPLQDQQRLLQEQRAKQELERRRHLDAEYGSQETQFWDKFEGGKPTSNGVVSPPTYTATDEYGGQKLSHVINRPFSAISHAEPQAPQTQAGDDDDDLLSAFKGSSSVDASSNFPPPIEVNRTQNTSEGGIKQTPKNSKAAPFSTLGHPTGTNGTSTLEIDDDTFGLGTQSYGVPKPDNSATGQEDDDVLGLLGRPVSELPQPQQLKKENPNPAAKESTGAPDRAVAELVDMGFSADKSRDALATTGSGVDIQAAVSWLLTQAHEDSQRESRPQGSRLKEGTQGEVCRPHQETGVATGSGTEAAMPAWMRQQSRSNSAIRREESVSPVNGEKDTAKYATELGNNLLKTANSLWKTSTKKINQAVADFSSESEPDQPKWMREAYNARQQPPIRHPQVSPRTNNNEKAPATVKEERVSVQKPPTMTDEALMLESGDSHQPGRQIRQRATKPALPPSPRDQSPSSSIRSQDARLSRPSSSQQRRIDDPRSKLSRQVAEEQTSQAYISPARRKKTAPRAPTEAPDLLYETSQTMPRLPTIIANPAPPTPRPRITTPRASVPIPPSRIIPQLSFSALQSSTSYREAGTTAFKLGNYADATSAYTSSLSSLPSKHPLTVVILTNRALTHLKTGDPKACIADADTALDVIGSSRGHGEFIDLGSGEGSKDMQSFWGKAMTRKAEAFEQLERWEEGAKTWRQCVEAGVGGNTSIQGRNRCDRATGARKAQNSPTARKRPTATKSAPTKSSPAISALDSLSGSSHFSGTVSAEAVNRLRAANAEADRVDDEKFALADSVDERLTSWRKGKEGNLRALLGSLDMVLWEGAGWKKVGMSELIIPGKVKVAYMKGIAKVHPDKVGDDHMALSIVLGLSHDHSYHPRQRLNRR